MNRTATGIVAAIVLAISGLGFWWWLARSDDFDYEAAFENLPETAELVAAPVPLGDFAGKPRSEAESVVGKPYDCDQSLYGERCRYPQGIEIVYVDGRADWITVSFGYGRHPLAPETLQQLGLAVAPQQQTNPHRLRWTQLPGLRELELVGDDNGAIYARIKVIHG